MKKNLICCTCLGLGALLYAEGDETEREYKIPDGKSFPQPEKIDADTVAVGKAVIHLKDKSVSFPAVFNMKEGLIEYVVNMPHGKVHECLLLTEADPLHISLAMKLAKFTAFEHFFPMRDENLEWLPFTPPKPEEYANAYVQVKITWKEGDKTRESDCSDLILHARTKAPFPADEWLYTNSFFYQERYQASLTGDVISIFADRSSPVNYIGEFNKGVNDVGWIVNKDVAPEPGTEATVTISQKPRAARKDGEQPSNSNHSQP